MVNLYPQLFEPSSEELFDLKDGAVSIPKVILKFKKWSGPPIINTYNNKAVIDSDGEPLFAELVVLKSFKARGWDGVWVDSYGKKYRVGLPGVVDPVKLPTDKQALIDRIRKKTGRFGGCWDLLVWKGKKILFIELKKTKKDRIQPSQVVFLGEALKLNFTSGNFILAEWDFVDKN